jgi:hypothetical protein
VPIQLGSNLIKTDLLLLDLEGMDVLLGMDWMTRHRVSLDISSRAVEIDSPNHETTILYIHPTMKLLFSIFHNGSVITLVPML